MYTYVCVIFIYEYNARARAHTRAAHPWIVAIQSTKRSTSTLCREKVKKIKTLLDKGTNS